MVPLCALPAVHLQPLVSADGVVKCFGYEFVMYRLKRPGRLLEGGEIDGGFWDSKEHQGVSRHIGGDGTVNMEQAIDPGADLGVWSRPDEVSLADPSTPVARGGPWLVEGEKEWLVSRGRGF